MEYRYKRAHQQLFKKANKTLQDKISTVKNNPNLKDPEVEEFVQQVILLAEGDKEI